jgi:hypothetical protein
VKEKGPKRNNRIKENKNVSRYFDGVCQMEIFHFQDSKFIHFKAFATLVFHFLPQ